MDGAKYLAVGRIFLEETRAAGPVPQTVEEARPWHAALMLKCAERSLAEQGASFVEWRETEPTDEVRTAYCRMAEDVLGWIRPS